MNPATTPGLADQITQRLNATAPTCGPSRVVLIDGRSGSGKSTLAAQVLPLLPGAQLIQLDLFYPGWTGLEAGARLIAERVLPALASGQDIEVPTWDWYADAPGPERRYAAGAPYLVVEGVGSAITPARPYGGLVVWLDGDPEARRQRAVRRDGEDTARHWSIWAEQEEALIARHHQRAAADLVSTNCC